MTKINIYKSVFIGILLIFWAVSMSLLSKQVNAGIFDDDNSSIFAEETDSSSIADLEYYETDRYQADESVYIGKCFGHISVGRADINIKETTNRYRADKKVHIVDNKYEADTVICTE